MCAPVVSVGFLSWIKKDMYPQSYLAPLPILPATWASGSALYRQNVLDCIQWLFKPCLTHSAFNQLPGISPDAKTPANAFGHHITSLGEGILETFGNIWNMKALIQALRAPAIKA